MSSKNVKTGKDIYENRIKSKVESRVNNYPDYVKGFYYSLRNSGRTTSVKTQDVYTGYVIRFLEETNKSVQDITYDDITFFLVNIGTKPNGKKASGSYMVAVYSALKKFFKYLIATKRIIDNPMENIERPAPKPSDQVKRCYLEVSEINNILSSLNKSWRDYEAGKNDDKYALRDLAIISLFLNTGIRLQALTNLDIGDIDHHNKTVTVIDKGNKKKICYLNNNTFNILVMWCMKAIVYNGYKSETVNKDMPIFVSNRKKRMSESTVENIIRRRCKIEGKNITPHKLRATYATQMLNAGCGLYEVQQLMGHSSPKTTEIYIQGQEENIKQASKLANTFLNFN